MTPFRLVLASGSPARRDLLKRAGFELPAKEFKRVASARTLYHWNAEAHQEY